ncbi:MAG: hypothetical protein FWF37_00240 [Chloroflexi bacterium]|nr:hypothetical protein [Chloroflexota bacterium]
MWIDEIVFTKSVQEYFSFLKEKYNLEIQSKKCAECVSFKSDITWLEIWFDKYSLYIEMGMNNGLYQTSLGEIKQFITGESDSVSYMASDEEKLRKGLQRLSDYVKLYCHKALYGDIEFYKEVKENQERLERERALENKINNIEELAKIALKKHDYKKVIDLYNQILEHLSPIQKKRLSMCEKYE